MKPLTSRLSAKGQTTIPKPVRESLRITEGDTISFEVKEDEVVLRKVPMVDFEWAGAVEPTLSEWEDDLDNDVQTRRGELSPADREQVPAGFHRCFSAWVTPHV